MRGQTWFSSLTAVHPIEHWRSNRNAIRPYVQASVFCCLQFNSSTAWLRLNGRHVRGGTDSTGQLETGDDPLLQFGGRQLQDLLEGERVGDVELAGREP